MSSPSRRKRRSLKELSQALCRIYSRLERSGISPSDLQKKKHLSAVVRRLRQQIDSEFFEVNNAVVEGTADVDRVRAAILSLKVMIGRNQPLLRHQRKYLSDALSRFAGPRSLDQAFGVASTRVGRPHVSEQAQQEIATEVLRLHLKGESLESAAYQVGEKFDLGSTQVRKYWVKNKLAATVLLRSERVSGQYPWKKSEATRLERIWAKHNKAVSEFIRREEEALAAAASKAKEGYSCKAGK